MKKTRALGNNAGLEADYQEASPELIKKLHADPLSVGTWTVPKSKWKERRKLGVDYITTDD